MQVEPLESERAEQSRLAREEANAWHQRLRDLIVMVVVLVGLIAITGACLFISLNRDGSPEDRKWAMAVLASIVAGGLGFVSGKGQRASG